MKIKTRKVNEVTILDVMGEIVIGEGDVRLRTTILDLLAQGETNILLSLRNVPFIDSAGIGEIIACHTSVKNRGGSLKLLHLTKKLKHIFTITKLILVFDCFDDQEEAVQSFSKQP